MTDLTLNSAAHRFEMRVDGHVAFLTFHMEGDTMSLDHTEVPKVLNGRGVGSALVRGVLQQARAQGMKVLPRCPFVAAFIERHPGFSELVA